MSCPVELGTQCDRVPCRHAAAGSRCQANRSTSSSLCGMAAHRTRRRRQLKGRSLLNGSPGFSAAATWLARLLAPARRSPVPSPGVTAWVRSSEAPLVWSENRGRRSPPWRSEGPRPTGSWRTLPGATRCTMRSPESVTATVPVDQCWWWLDGARLWIAPWTAGGAHYRRRSAQAWTSGRSQRAVRPFSITGDGKSAYRFR